MSLKPGTKSPLTPNGYVSSMAEAMENAFRQEWPFIMKDAPLPTANEEMKLMFIAIARGVVQHLHDNHDAFNVTVTLTGSNTAKGTVSEIDVV